MLFEIAIGDAYGAAFEYVPRAFIDTHHRVEHYVQRPKGSIAPGHYTDDTQMSIAVAEALLSDERWTPAVLADHFVRAYRRDQRLGYASGFQRLLDEVRSGSELLQRIRNRSDKSGAAMRAPPIGLLPRIGDVLQYTEVQARITHDTPQGIGAAQAAALLTHYFAYDVGDKADVGRFIESYVDGPWGHPWVGEVGSKGWMSVRAAITAVVEGDRLSDVLYKAVDFGGDVDTVAAIAMGAASWSRDIERDIPKALEDGLEAGPFGAPFLRDLDERLVEAFRL